MALELAFVRVSLHAAERWSERVSEVDAGAASDAMRAFVVGGELAQAPPSWWRIPSEDREPSWYVTNPEADGICLVVHVHGNAGMTIKTVLTRAMSQEGGRARSRRMLRPRRQPGLPDRLRRRPPGRTWEVG